VTVTHLSPNLVLLDPAPFFHLPGIGNVFKL
jgi:hypothetical protein